MNEKPKYQIGDRVRVQVKVKIEDYIEETQVKEYYISSIEIHLDIDRRKITYRYGISKEIHHFTERGTISTGYPPFIRRLESELDFLNK